MIAVPRIVRRVLPEHGPWPAHIPGALQRVYAGRGVHDPEEAELKLAHLLPPVGLGNLDRAVGLLADAIAHRERIVIVGDFDCDGATGTAVAVRGLRLLGAEQVGYRVPHRITHGYGLSPALVEDMAMLEPDLLVTVDNGIACLAGIAAAKARGWKVLVTDHHLPGPVLPAADAIVNPNLDGDAFPSKALAGVGVMFYLLLALRRRLREQGRFKGDEPDLSVLLDLVAVGTIADLVPLDRNNRLLVSAGLRRLRRGQCQPGLRALAEVAGRALDNLVAGDIGFALGPRLNAAGRLEDMAIGIECLLCDDIERARTLAAVLDGINAERRGLQQSMVDEAEVLVHALPLDGDRLPAGLALFDPSWHPGVIGLVASKIKDRSHRPVIAFAPADEHSALLRGSARSITGFHIRDALAAIDARHPGLIERFGGHAMAAGLSLRIESLEEFRIAFAAYAEATLAPELLRAELLSDGPLAAHEFDRSTAEALRMAGPWGQGFAEPLFDNIFVVREWRVVREKHLKFVLTHEDSITPISAIHFGGWNGEPPPDRIHAAYQLELDDFRGRDGVQLLVRHWHPAPVIVGAA
jgi:single-stranded-DNA-specific exonuclease